MTSIFHPVVEAAVKQEPHSSSSSSSSSAPSPPRSPPRKQQRSPPKPPPELQTPQCWGRPQEVLEIYRKRVNELEALGQRKPDMVAFKELKGLAGERQHGALPGVPGGLYLKNRGEAAILGIHQSICRGIDYEKDEACYAVCLSGAYLDDDETNNGAIHYTGEGGRGKNGRQERDQLESPGNQALIRSSESDDIVRLLKGTSKAGYFYMGLYRCTGYTYEKGHDGWKVYRFTLEPLMKNQCPLGRSFSVKRKWSKIAAPTKPVNPLRAKVEVYPASPVRSHRPLAKAKPNFMWSPSQHFLKMPKQEVLSPLPPPPHADPVFHQDWMGPQTNVKDEDHENRENGEIFQEDTQGLAPPPPFGIVKQQEPTESIREKGGIPRKKTKVTPGGSLIGHQEEVVLGSNPHWNPSTTLPTSAAARQQEGAHLGEPSNKGKNQMRPDPRRNMFHKFPSTLSIFLVVACLSLSTGATAFQASSLTARSQSSTGSHFLVSASNYHRESMANLNRLPFVKGDRHSLIPLLAMNGGNSGGDDTAVNGKNGTLVTEGEASSKSGLPTDKSVKQLISLFWQMASPYYKESKSGRNLFLGVIALTLVNSGVSVAFSYLGKDFWNALSSKDVEAFYGVLKQYVPALLVGAPVATYYRYQRAQLAISWREWMTDRTLEIYASERIYYALERGREVDNPDQRIAEDVNSFTGYSLQLFITIVTSIIDLVSFSFILYSIYPELFGAILIYAVFGTLVTTWLGKPLVKLNFQQLQKEADFRYSLVRLRENCESIAFYAGEALEGKGIQTRFNKVVENTKQVNVAERNLEFFTTGYRYIIQILPVAVVAPKYFAGKIQLGQISQSVGAFNHILSDLSIIINQFERLSGFAAGIDRLAQFFEAVQKEDATRTEDTPLLRPPLAANTTDTKNGGIDSEGRSEVVMNGSNVGGATKPAPNTIDLQRMASGSKVLTDSILSFQNVDLTTPDGKRLLVNDLTMTLKQGTHLLIVGASGAGKSSLLRAIAGLWTSGNGSIVRPCDEEVYFLPQRPYCSLGTLKDQLLYPSIDEMDGSVELPDGISEKRSHLLQQSLSDQDLLDILEQVDLKELPTRVSPDGDPVKGLYVDLDWSNTLSLGEQQRLAFGRLLVNKPRLCILDEATSALDMVAEAKMYMVLQNMARNSFENGKWSEPGLTYVSVGHRPSLLSYHDKRLRLGGTDSAGEAMPHEVTDIEKNSVSLPTDISNL